MIVDKAIENNKIHIQNRQDAIDSEIVNKCLIYKSSSKKINLAYYIDQRASLKKKLKACNREAVQIDVKRKKNLVMQLNTSVFQFIVQKMVPFLIQNEPLEIELK